MCGAIEDLPWRNIWLADNPVDVLNEYLSLLVGRYGPTDVIRVRKKAFAMVCRSMQACLWPQAEGSSSVDSRSLLC